MARFVPFPLSQLTCDYLQPRACRGGTFGALPAQGNWDLPLPAPWTSVPVPWAHGNVLLWGHPMHPKLRDDSHSPLLPGAAPSLKTLSLFPPKRPKFLPSPAFAAATRMRQRLRLIPGQSLRGHKAFPSCLVTSHCHRTQRAKHTWAKLSGFSHQPRPLWIILWTAEALDRERWPEQGCPATANLQAHGLGMLFLFRPEFWGGSLHCISVTTDSCSICTLCLK